MHAAALPWTRKWWDPTRLGIVVRVDSLRGQLLIAPPHLTDPNFSKTVVFIVQHDKEGAFGLVLNRPSDTAIDEIWEKMRGRRCVRKDFLYVGGPVQGPLMLLHGDALAGDIEVIDGVYCCAQANELEERVDDERPPMRFYAGYSGLGGGQLEMELSIGSWLSLPAEARHVFYGEGDDLWTQVFRKYVDKTSLPDGFLPKDDEPSRN